MNSLRKISSRFLANYHNTCYRFGTSVRDEYTITRDWLAKLWAEDKKRLASLKSKQGNVRNVRARDVGIDEPSPVLFRLPFRQSVLSRAAQVLAEKEEGRMKKTTTTAKQPPVSQNLGGVLCPSSPEEVKLAPLLARSNLVITRDIEWANIMFAIEQESRYSIVDACYPGVPVGFIHEQSNLIFRQLLRTRRPFTALIIDAMGTEIFTIRRPFWLINSSIYAEIDGKEIGVVHRRWHLWRRIYDLYLGNKQFAVVENPGFWNWTFTLKDEDDNVLAQIDRDWRGVGFELFTDAGQYVIRFGDADSSTRSGLASTIEELEVVRPLTLAERAVAVALAVSLDSDYFSSRRGGWGLPFLVATE